MTAHVTVPFLHSVTLVVTVSQLYKLSSMNSQFSRSSSSSSSSSSRCSVSLQSVFKTLCSRFLAVPRHILMLSNSTRPTTYIVRMDEAGSSSKDVVSSGNPDYVEVIVVRNGETACDIDGRFEGQQDVELNGNGMRQAIDVACQLYWNPRPIACIYTSDLKRAVETAQFISRFCKGAEVIEDPDLRDIHFGVLQDFVPTEEFATVGLEAYKVFISNSRGQEFPGGGESIDQFSQRCTSCLQRIVQKHKGKQIIVVTHWSVIAAFYERCGSKNCFPDEKTLNTSVSIFLVADGGKWILKQWNDVSHLNPRGMIHIYGL